MNDRSPSAFARTGACQTASIAVIVPTYCEAANLPVLVPRVAAALQRTSRSGELLVIDDGSPDETSTICCELARRFPLRLFIRPHKRGLADAVLFGLEHASSEVAVVMDADLSHPPEKIPDLVSPLLTTDCDLTVGSRFVSGGAIIDDWGWYRHLNSRVARLLARPLTPTRDCLSGFFALRTQILRRTNPLTPIGFKILLEIIVKCRPRHIREIPILFSDRRAGHSKLSLHEQVNYLRHLARLYQFKLISGDPR